MPSDFSWIPIYKELARRLLAFESRQAEVLALLRSLQSEGLPMIPLTERGREPAEPLATIDPFTVFATFNRRITPQHRTTIIGRLGSLLRMEAPAATHFDGIPIANNLQSCFFGSINLRRPGDIPDLWTLARSAVSGGLQGVSEELFDRCLQIRAVGIAKLTMGLFWMRPDEFMPCDSNSTALFRQRGLGIPRSYRTYRELIDRLRPEVPEHFAELSRHAWEADDDSGPAGPRASGTSGPGSDLAITQQVVEQILPVANERRTTLKLLLSSIRRAHNRNPSSWGLTVRGRRVRLNVGRLRVLDLREGKILVVAQVDRVPQRFSVFRRIQVEPYAVCPDGGDYVFPPSELSNIDPAFVDAHLAVVDQLTDVRRTPYYRAHSPGALEYLRRELGEDVPTPAYGTVDVDPWDEFVRWGREILEFPGAMEAERPYKIKIAQRAEELLEAMDAAPAQWLPLLRRVFDAPNNLTYYVDHERLIEWAQAQPAGAKAALEALWDEAREPQERVDGFAAAVPTLVLSAPGSRANIASVLMMALDPEQYPPFRSTVFSKGYRLTGTEAPPSNASPGVQYALALRFLDRMIHEFQAREVELPDRLEAQGVLWCLSDASRERANVAPEHVDELLRYVGESPSVWWLNEDSAAGGLLEPNSIWLPAERLREGAAVTDLRLRHLLPDEVVLRVRAGAICSINSVRQKASQARRGEPPAPGWRVRFDVAALDAPIRTDEIPLDLRRSEPAVFNEDGSLVGGLLHRLGPEASDAIRERFSERWPRTSPWAGRPRQCWLFQSNPAYWSLKEWLERHRVGEEEDFTITHHREEIRSGDSLILWQSGADAGVYGLAEVISEPVLRPAGDWRRQRGDATTDEWAARFRLMRHLDPPIDRSQLAHHPVLAGLDVIRLPRGTNYRVTQEQWAAVEELIGEEPTPRLLWEDVGVSEIRAHVARKGLRIADRTLRRFHHSLKTRGFVILSGPSGAGKTWLAECYAEAVGAASELVPVAPNWTSNEDLLGHWNPLAGEYVHTNFSRFLVRAADEFDRAEEQRRLPRPHLVILDEMNLARVEHYFAEFLSRMEVRARHGRAEIQLGPEEKTWLTPNLQFVGTVNVDETTHGFADKVYDRAQTLELTVERDELASLIGDPPYRDFLLEVWSIVEPVAPFAFRVAEEIRRYIDQAAEDAVTWEEALDEQILQKVLPKLSGADPSLRSVLQQLSDLSGRLPLTARKAQRMLRQLDAHGFASYF